jgi:hypothetical protein
MMIFMSHTLIIEDDFSWEIEHPEECWYSVTDDTGFNVQYWDTDCAVSGKINWDPQPVKDFEALQPGRYTLTYRHDGEGERYEDWLAIEPEGDDS